MWVLRQTKGAPRDLDPDEPMNTARAIQALGVKHAVITSVNRDELPDGGEPFCGHRTGDPPMLT